MNKKIISVLLVFIMIFSASIGSFAVSKEEIQASLEDEIAQKEKEIAQYQQKIDSLKGDANKQDEYIDELQKQIHLYDDELELLQGQIDELNTKIATLDGEISEFEAKIQKLEGEIASVETQIAAKQVEVDEAYDLLSDRLCAAYMAGETSMIEIFLSAKDFSDFIERSELVYQIAKHDTSLVDGIKQSIDALNQMMADLDGKKSDLEESKALLDSQRAQLDESRETVKESKAVLDGKVATIQSKIDQVNSYIGSLNKQSAQYQKLIDQANAQKAAFKTEIDNLVNNEGSKGDGNIVDGGPTSHHFEISTRGIICPLQGYTVRFNEHSWDHVKRGNHNRAVDLSGTTGKPIYAVASGTVMKAAYDSYSGNHILIDHGSGVVTYYGHCSSMIVSKGTKVAQGQVIGYVGSTGVVTGPHLHFEVRVNGTQVTPEDYLKKSNGNYISPLA